MTNSIIQLKEQLEAILAKGLIFPHIEYWVKYLGVSKNAVYKWKNINMINSIPKPSNLLLIIDQIFYQIRQGVSKFNDFTLFWNFLDKKIEDDFGIKKFKAKTIGDYALRDKNSELIENIELLPFVTKRSLIDAYINLTNSILLKYETGKNTEELNSLINKINFAMDEERDVRRLSEAVELILSKYKVTDKSSSDFNEFFIQAIATSNSTSLCNNNTLSESCNLKTNAKLEPKNAT